MKDTRSIEEQVAELTEKQKDTIVKIDLFSGLAVILGSIPILLIMIFNFILLISQTLSPDAADALFIVNLVIMIVGVLLIIGGSVLINVLAKIIFPYYSGKKCSYIKKSRKKK